MATVELRNSTAFLRPFGGIFFLGHSEGIQRSILGEPSLDCLKVLHLLSIKIDFKMSIAIILGINLNLFACNIQYLVMLCILKCQYEDGILIAIIKYVTVYGKRNPRVMHVIKHLRTFVVTKTKRRRAFNDTTLLVY